LRQSLHALWDTLFGSVEDLAPIVLVIAFFQLVALQQPLPDLLDMLLGVLLVVPGPTAFVYGLEMGLFPVGESMAVAASPTRCCTAWWPGPEMPDRSGRPRRQRDLE